MAFVHLHTHTEYSLLDGAARISKLIKTAKEHGAPAAVITDHGNMYGTYKFYKKCKEEGIKAIIGCEIYIVDDLTIKHPKEHRGHLILLAKNNEGYTNLCKINAKAWIEGFYFKPRIDYNFLAKHSKGIICLSGCLAGHLNHYLLKNMYDEAKKYAQLLKDIFGADFYIELQNQGMPEQKHAGPGLVKLAEELGIEVVATNDVHYINADDAEMQDALMCVEMRKTIDDPERLNMLEISDQFYLKTEAEMAKLFDPNAKGVISRALSNSIVIADKCNCHPFVKSDLIPEFVNPEGTDNAAYFRKKIEAGLRERYGKITPEVRERYEREFKVINDNKFIDYFLIVADFMEYANQAGIAVGPGRGSGAGSIIAYALNITKLDPLKYNLLFERFLHNERVSMPDFDLDFCCNRREEVIDYVINKYGADKVCQIVTFGTLAAKAAIKDIARVFKMPYAEVDKITKPIQVSPTMKPPLIPYIFDLKKLKNPKDDPAFATLSEKEKEKKLDEAKKEQNKMHELRNTELVNLYKNNPEVKKIVDMALKVEGFPRNCSTHAAGVIICKKVVGDVTPLQRNGTDITSQFDMKEIEELGMLKMDFLGLITLTDIQGTLKDIKEILGVDIDFYDGKEYGDQEVYKMIASGDTDAVFQLESGGYKRFMKDMRPNCIEDIIAAMALFRPGPMDMIPDYCKNKHNPKRTTYEHPSLAPILKNTYGQIVYQEQVMDIFKFLGGYNLGQADMVRRAMGKKDAKEMDRQKDIFVNGSEKMGIRGAVANGVPNHVAKSIFDKMAKFAGYAFNKSHAACYAFIAYQTAFLKHYYYPYYMANVLNNRVNKWDDMTKYIISIRSHGVKVLPPDINKSKAFFSVESDKGQSSIRFGLAALKNAGAALIENILAERAQRGSFKSFQDFCKRVDSGALNKRVLESLILSGAFDGFGNSRSSLMTGYPAIVKNISGEKKVTDAGQISMFGNLITQEAEAEIPKVREYDNFTKLKFEKDVVGIYLSGHPLQQYAKLFADFSFNTSFLQKNEDEHDGPESEDHEQTGFVHNQTVIFGAIIQDIKRMVTKAAKKEMAVLRVEDMFGSCEVMLFPNIYERVKNLAVKDAVIRISGKLSVREGEDTMILADDISLLTTNAPRITENEPKDPETQPRAANKRLYLRFNTKDEEILAEAVNILEAYKGNCEVIVRCLATGEAKPFPHKVRDCRAILFELASTLGEDNVVFK